jgi:ATP-binding cassette subfamily B protein/subfamily B ATP-binding cassette protein MsbA
MKWWWRLFGYARQHSSGMILLIAGVLAGVLIDLLTPWPLKLILDAVVAGRPLPAGAAWIASLPGAATKLGMLVWLTAGTIVIFAAGWANKVAQTYIQTGFGNRMMYSLGEALFDHLQRLSLGFHSTQRIGDIVKRITTDTACIRDLILSVLVPAITSTGTLTLMFFIMWRLDPAVAVVAMIAAPPISFAIWYFSGPMNRETYAQSETQGDMMALTEQTLTALPVVRAFGREAHEDDRFRQVCHRSDQAYRRLIASQMRFKAIVDSIIALATASIMAIGGWHVLSGSLSIGSLLVVISYLALLYTPMATFAYLAQSFAAAAAGARRVFEILDSPIEVKDRAGARAVPAPAPGACSYIRFENVGFSYDANRSILKGIEFEVQAGEMIALVGATGAGKSTLVSLLLRFFDPQEGRVLLNGVDLRDLQVASLRSQISIVLQEPLLLPISIADNIAYGRPAANRDEVIAAAVAANADDFIRRLPDGYDTVLSERGGGLSGGERQRLSIARALLKNAPILILDEPTSALDAETESAIMEALDRLMEGRTTFVIAHRLSTVRRADRILVLDRGRLVETGTHDQLLVHAGRYAYLHQLQTVPVLL